MTERKIRVFIVDDHSIVRQGLLRVIEAEPDMTVCGEAPDAPSAVQRVPQTKPDLVVVDLELEHGNGIELIKSLEKIDPRVKILVLTLHDETYFVERALRAGAHGYLTKQEASEKVVAAIRAVVHGDLYVSDRVSSDVMKRLLSREGSAGESPIDGLSDRELEVFLLIGGGLSSKEIADNLGLSIKTIESYRAQIKEKLDLTDSRKLVQYAIRWVVSRGMK